MLFHNWSWEAHAVLKMGIQKTEKPLREQEFGYLGTWGT
jgi:hypothetical protein